MVGEPLFRMGEDFMGIRLPMEMDPPRTEGLGLAGRGCATVDEKESRYSSHHQHCDHRCRV